MGLLLTVVSAFSGVCFADVCFACVCFVDVWGAIEFVFTSFLGKTFFSAVFCFSIDSLEGITFSAIFFVDAVFLPSFDGFITGVTASVAGSTGPAKRTEVPPVFLAGTYSLSSACVVF